jgi:hypothetical protein
MLRDTRAMRNCASQASTFSTTTFLFYRSINERNESNNNITKKTNMEQRKLRSRTGAQTTTT